MSAQASAIALVQQKDSLVKKTKKSGETESESAKVPSLLQQAV